MVYSSNSYYMHAISNGLTMWWCNIAFLFLTLFVTWNFLGVYVKGRVQPSQCNSRRSSSRKKSSYPGEVWDTVFYCLRDSGMCFCISVLAWMSHDSCCLPQLGAFLSTSKCPAQCVVYFEIFSEKVSYMSFNWQLLSYSIQMTSFYKSGNPKRKIEMILLNLKKDITDFS